MAKGRDKGDRKATILIGTPNMDARTDPDLDSLPPGPPDESPEAPRASEPPEAERFESEAPDSEPEPEAEPESEAEAESESESEAEAESESESESEDDDEDEEQGEQEEEEEEEEGEDDDSDAEIVVERPSLLLELRKKRTTMIELSSIADRLSRIQEEKRPEPSIVKQMALSFAISLTVVLLVAMIFVGGTWRIVLGIMGGTCGMSLAVFGGFRALPRIAKWIGPRELPGSPLVWLGGVALMLASGAGVLVWQLSEVTASLAMIGVPEVTPPPMPTAEPSASAEVEEGRADAKVKVGTRKGFNDGVVYLPPSFSSEDGHFDLIVHFHGNTDLVAESVAQVGINAVVYIVNFGESSKVYAQPFSNPDAFDVVLTGVEKRVAEMGLRSPRIDRIAIMSWSAGYGAVYQILRSRSRLDRVDALLMLDSFHASVIETSPPTIDEPSVAPFLAFAKRAVAGEKLMMLTHAKIQVQGYASTLDSANALLERLQLVREDVDPKTASPPIATLPVAQAAFPARQQNWLKVTSAVHKKNFHVLGCKGNDKPDHIAHLAQISTTVLPLLAERWKKPEKPPKE